MTFQLADLLQLQPIEKLRIITALEESLFDTTASVLSDEQKEVVRRRHRDHLANPDRALNWEQFERALDAEHG